MYGRIFKSLHILAYIDTDETYRRDIKGIRNLQEGRHGLAGKIFHGRKGHIHKRYHAGIEDPLSALEDLRYQSSYVCPECHGR